MKKHHKITASERDQIAWWLAYRVTIREMVRRLGRSMQGTQLPDILEVFTAEFRPEDFSKRTLFEKYPYRLSLNQHDIKKEPFLYALSCGNQ